MNPFVESSLKTVFSGKKILLGITGSIAAFKAIDLIRFLKKMDAEVQVVLTDSATHFVSELTLETLTGRRVLKSIWTDEAQGNHHIDTARWADLVLVAPASAPAVRKFHGSVGWRTS